MSSVSFENRKNIDMRSKTLRKTVAVALMLFVLLASSTFNSFILVNAGIWDVNYVIQTTVTYSNKGTTVWNLAKGDQTISLFMNNTWQTVSLTECSYSKKTGPDEDGNPIAVLQLKSKLEPRENVTYTVTYNVESKPRSMPHLDERELGNLTIPDGLKKEYCIEGDAWQINDLTLKQTAHTIAENETNVLLIVEKFVAWIWDNIDYTSYEFPRYPNETLSDGRGDCDDQAILLITFCRIREIPSYLQIGCIYQYGSTTQKSSWNGTVTSVLKQIAWHGWAMVYVPPWGWLPVDLTYVKGGKDDPLNAIKTGAVTSQRTIQYMNISQRDYVASTRKYRKFLIGNQIYIYKEDEMSMAPQNFLEEFIKTWIRWFLIVMVIITGTLIAVFGYILKKERRRFRELNQHDEELRMDKKAFSF